MDRGRSRGQWGWEVQAAPREGVACACAMPTWSGGGVHGHCTAGGGTRACFPLSVLVHSRALVGWLPQRKGSCTRTVGWLVGCLLACSTRLGACTDGLRPDAASLV